MNKSKALRVGGFVVAVAASAALIGAATGATGAYFTDSHDGAINASTGTVKVDVSPADLQLNFNGLLPGEFQNQPVKYKNTGTGAEDIWLVLPSGTFLNAVSDPTAPPGSPPLGRYGHFAVSAPNGSFTSYNTASNRVGDTSTPCSVDAYGRGGSNQQAATRDDYSVPYCPVPNAILLSWNLAPGTGWQTADITFGFTKLLHGPEAQGQGPTLIAPFKIVATQHGVMPNDPNN